MTWEEVVGRAAGVLLSVGVLVLEAPGRASGSNELDEWKRCVEERIEGV